ncbi:G-type lectin S-receptor-like serine/threonine-protein kinase LECRK1 [Eucalyptus grandis]|uniref:G-type lectin S-receptor-like serine/threonine-protein kinase LECRK1 n=1 Tax=Eucalyptus grandis TaxID=71139 RepID=UPI00192EAABF|nr:G-type lectin S-receptor-like serine/threonine-protein kinase LECRK1 [Eucalyptus grandis]
MSNGTLADFYLALQGPAGTRRIEIACDVARGLSYLHDDCTRHIIHCDIKPQNILLDGFLTAKISDFGLAKLLMANQTRTTTGVRGTRGYLAPEWFRNMPISSKVDVYSFGILLVELICCRKNYKPESKIEAQIVLVDWAYDCYHDGSVLTLVESDEEASSDIKRVGRFVMTALWCIQEDPSLRPTMKKITRMLEGVVEVPVPQFQALLSVRSWYHQAQDGQREGPISKSEISLYVLEVAYGKGTIDPSGGSVIDAVDPNLEEPESPVHSAEGSNWSVKGDDEEDEDP